MSGIKVQDLDSPAVPFFARYLEGQHCEDLSEQESSAVGGGRGGPIYATRKYPSDHEDGSGITSKIKDVIAVTLKYPSDHEDGGVITDKVSDQEAYTKKYPSDHEEFVTTQKYPSDQEDGGVAIDIAL